MSEPRAEPIWLDSRIAYAVQDRQLAEHGGGTGVHDAGALESALGRPINRWSYGEDELVELAAAYAFGIARNHPFVDGNKRTAWIMARLFLLANAVEIAFDRVDATNTVIALAAGELSVDELADWFRQRVVAGS